MNGTLSVGAKGPLKETVKRPKGSWTYRDRFRELQW